jgi:O-antigen/teichoic acid export membrane protein
VLCTNRSPPLYVGGRAHGRTLVPSVVVVANEAEGAPEGNGAQRPEGAVRPALPAAAVASGPGALSEVAGGGPQLAEQDRKGLHFKKGSPFRVIARGSSWVTASQLIILGGNLALTPFMIHGLGVERYGLFVLTATMAAFLGNFNGGLAATANRYFPIYAGTDDRVATTRLLVTFVLLVLVLGVVTGLVAWFVSPLVVNLLKMSTSLRAQSLFLFRTLAVLLVLGLVHQLVAAVITARQRFDRVIQCSLLCYAIWVGGLVWVVEHHEGLRGVAIVFVAQQAATVVVIVPTACRYLTKMGLSLLPWHEVRQLLSFSFKMQVGGLAWFLNNQLDTFIVGTLSVRTVGIYNTGNSLATQLNSLVSNVLGPTAVQLGNTYGKEGSERVFEQFRRMQRIWVAAVTGWSAVGMAAAYFGVVAWLGPGFHLGGWVAVVIIAGYIPVQCAGMLSLYINALLQAGIEMRYGLVMLALNMVLMVPLSLLGAIAVAAAAGVAQVVSAAYFVHMARRTIRADIPNFFKQMPVLRAAAAAIATLALEFLLRPHLSTGPLGLIECVPPAIVGLALYALLLAGPRRAAGFVVTTVRSRELPRVASWGSSK